MVGLHLVVMPALHHAGIHYRQIDLAEFLEELVVVAEDFHQQAAFVWNHLEAFDLDAVDHALLARRLRAADVRRERRARGARPLARARARPSPRAGAGRPRPTPTCTMPAAATSSGS